MRELNVDSRGCSDRFVIRWIKTVIIETTITTIIIIIIVVVVVVVVVWLPR